MGVFGAELQHSNAIIEKLELLDLHCLKQNVNAEILVVGGAALLLLMDYNNRPFRPTRDVDVTLLSSSDEEAIRKILAEVRIDTVDGIIDMPPIEDFREQKKWKIDVGFEAINVYVPKVELLACTKLFSKREKDLKDLLESDLLLLCDKDDLLSWVEDYKSNSIFISNPDLNVHQLEHIMQTKGII